MIYQHVHKKTKILPLTTSYIAHFFATSLIIFSLQISMPRLKCINFYQNSLKLGYFCQKMQNLLCFGGSAARPRSSRGWRFCSQTPAFGGREFLSQAPKKPPIANFWLRTWCFYFCYVILCKLILNIAGVFGFPQAALSLKNFAHPWFYS